MKLLFSFALLGSLAFAQALPVLKATEAQRYLYQRDDARMVILRSQAEPLLAEQAKIKAEVCKAAAIELAACKVDWETGDVTAVKTEVKPDPGVNVVPK
jgi:hypothetical protein